ncbi:MAG TPA: response regulator transcription factor [Kiritimatiellia bacterium]|nr:response regulator transcription factor [Kiritimatiellia bacterium]HRZ11261.1 response regulator transcription factor [Kiritimatiellia bacterium]HSA19112.1 response regulator transcription factor [Kiritimatiellia bacterium]
MAREHVLVVEDEEDIQELIRYNLAKDGFHVTVVPSSEDAFKRIKAAPPAVILLDLMLPGMNGLEFCKLIKGAPSTRGIPVIMVTARGEEADVVAGLELGADDYLTKPFSPRVLLARLRAVLRRRNAAEDDRDAPVHLRDLTIHPGRHEVKLKNKTIELSFTEFRLLQVLARRPGWVLTRQQIVDAVRGPDYPVTERSVDVQVVGLRKKLGAAGDYIETVRGVGYRFRE